MNQPDWIESMQVLQLQDGDTIVLKTDQEVSQAMVRELERIIKETFEPRFKDIKVLVLPDSMDIGVIRGAKDET